jgi:hypothetical protein
LGIAGTYGAQGGTFGEGGHYAQGPGGGGVGGGGGTGIETGGGGGGFGAGGGEGYAAGGAGGFGGGGGGGEKGPGGAAGFGGGSGGVRSGGGGAGMGGAIFNMQGNVTIRNSTITANTSLGGSGAAAANAGKGIAGAVFNLSGELDVLDSTIAANTAASYASQIYNLVYDGHTARVAHSALADTILADGIGPVDLVSDRTAYGLKEALGSASADATMFDLVGSFRGEEGGTVTGSPLSTDPQLGPLQGNGGPTPTMLPAPSSAAIDAGSSFRFTTDQRGLPRPVDFGGIANAGDGSDIGAVELQKACFGQLLPAETCHTLVVSLSGSGTGAVTAPGLSCPGMCSAAYGATSTVELSSLPAPGSRFAGWGGACTATGRCAVGMGADQAVTASFEAIGTSARASLAVLSALGESYPTFAVGRATDPLRATAAARRHHRGTTFAFTLDRAATVSITIERTVNGRRVGRSCLPDARSLRHHAICKRRVSSAVLQRVGHRGKNSVPFSGRPGGHPLKPGRYVAVFTAVDAAGASPAQALAFTIVSR